MICTPIPAPAFVSNQSEIIQIPAITFAVRTSSLRDGDIQAGTMTNAEGKYYAVVPFTQHGQRVCSFNLVHRDNDADSEITASLVKKRIVEDGNPFDQPVVMARIKTGVASGTAGVKTKTDVSIRQPVIDLRHALYYVELDFGSTLLEALGVQIEVHPTCS